MGITLTDVLLFGKAQSSDVDSAAFAIMRRNILRWGAIGGYVSIVVHGVAPLVLPDAIANSLSYVKAFGGTEQNGTPTPDAPVDIVSNNGVLKVNSQGQIYADGTVETIEDTIGNTATTEMLLKVGDYQDEQEILSGAITRNVGVKVLDGTESWTYVENSTNYGNFFNTPITSVSRSTSIPICNYFSGVAATYAYTHPSMPNKLWIEDNNRLRINAPENITTVTQFKQWLADQYAAGTPVIVLYPLATPTTESVAGQTLQVTDGDNTLEITQASLTGLELEAQYNAAVSLTIQEVQDANLDNNVTVTIQ